MAFYKVNVGDVPMTSDVNQYADAFQGAADVGQLYLADYINAPASPPTVALASGSGLSVGAYQYAYTYVTGYKKSDGTLIINGETSLSPIANITTTSGNQVVNLTNIGTSTAPYVIARRIYRTKVGGNTFYLLTQLNDNVSTTFTDSTADSALSTQTSPVSNTTGTYFSKINIGILGMMNINSGGANNNLHIQHNNGYIFNEAAQATYLTGNAYTTDGANWYRFNTSNPAAALVVQQGQDPQFWAIGSGTGPITWNQYRIFHEGNFNTRTHCALYLNTAQTLVGNSWNRIKFDVKDIDYLNEYSVSNWYVTVANTGVYVVAFNCRITNMGTVDATVRLGTNQLNRSGYAYDAIQIPVFSGTGTVNVSAAFVHFLTAGTQLEMRVWTDYTSNATLATGRQNTWAVISRIA